MWVFLISTNDIKFDIRDILTDNSQFRCTPAFTCGTKHLPWQMPKAILGLRTWRTLTWNGCLRADKKRRPGQSRNLRGTRRGHWSCTYKPDWRRGPHDSWNLRTCFCRIRMLWIESQGRCSVESFTSKPESFLKKLDKMIRFGNDLSEDKFIHIWTSLSKF